MKKERRYIPIGDIELRVEGEDGAQKISGLLAPYNVWSPVYGSGDFRWREKIAPGFFDGVLDGDVRALFNHSPHYVLGRTTSRTFDLSTDDSGLHGVIHLSTSAMVRDLVVIPMQRGDITGASFSFYLPATDGDTWSKGPDGLRERVLLKAAAIDDAGPVTFPFYPTTDVGVRSLEARHAEGALESLRRWEAEHGTEPAAWRQAALERERELREAELVE